MNEMFECNLPSCLEHDLEAWKKGFGGITHEQAEYLRDKYLWGKDV